MPTGIVCGQVKKRSTGKPIANRLLRIGSRSKQTDSNGVFYGLGPLEYGAYPASMAGETNPQPATVTVNAPLIVKNVSFA